MVQHAMTVMLPAYKAGLSRQDSGTYYLRTEDITLYEDANGADYGYDDLIRDIQANEAVIIPE